MCEFPEVERRKKYTKQFVIQAHLHCMKTHKPTYASHHYISFRELTTNNGNTMTMTTNDDDGDDGGSNYHAKIVEKSECAVCRFTSAPHILQPKYCLLITKPSAQRAYHITHVYMIIVAVRFVPWNCAVCSLQRFSRPVNLIRYFMRPNVSSYDCLFRIFSVSVSHMVLAVQSSFIL